MHDALDVARRRYAQIRANSHARNTPDHIRQLTEWLGRDVAAVVEGLLRLPNFRQLARWSLDRLPNGSQGVERQRVRSVDDALTRHATALAAVAREPAVWAELIRMGPPIGAPLTEQSIDAPYALDSMDAIARRPWCDLASATDFLGPAAGLNVEQRAGDGSPAQWVEFLPAFNQALRLPDDHIAGMVLRRVEFWAGGVLPFEVRVRTVLANLGQTMDSWIAAQRTARELAEAHEALAAMLLGAPDAELRRACVSLVQIHAAFRGAGALRGLGIPPGVPESMLRLRLERQGETAIAERADAALGNVVALYRTPPSPEELIAEAVASHRLALVATVGFRDVYWEGERLDVDWHGHSRKWDVVWALADRARIGEGVDRFVLGRATGPGVLRCAISQLKPLLPSALAVLIKAAGRGTYRLELPKGQIWIGEMLPADTIAVGADAGASPFANEVRSGAKLMDVIG